MGRKSFWRSMRCNAMCVECRVGFRSKSIDDAFLYQGY
jgi:hypothetical protein